MLSSDQHSVTFLLLQHGKVFSSGSEFASTFFLTDVFAHEHVFSVRSSDALTDATN